MSLYLHPLHGRLDPTQDMNDWGFNGPVLGPLVGVHGTYNTHLKLEFENIEDIPAIFTAADMMDFNVLELKFHEDLLVVDGKFYGDWVINEEPAE